MCEQTDHDRDTRIRRSLQKGLFGLISLIAWDDRGWSLFAQGFGTAPMPGFRIMDALPRDPRDTSLADLKKLVGLAVAVLVDATFTAPTPRG